LIADALAELGFDEAANPMEAAEMAWLTSSVVVPKALT
jgi:hypothetical protein